MVARTWIDTKKRWRWAVLLMSLMIFCAAPGASGPSTLLVIEGGLLLDGTGSPLRENGQIIIRRSVIESVTRNRATIPSGALVIKARGKTILPGLIDVHVHLGGSGGALVSPGEFGMDRVFHDLRVCLYAGVTTIKSLTDSLNLIQHLKRGLARGEWGPRIFAVGPAFTAPGGHPLERFKGPLSMTRNFAREVADAAQAREAVRALLGEDIDGIKVIYDGGAPEYRLPKLPLEVLQAIIDEAHRHRLIVSVHTGEARDLSEAVRAGADGIEHGTSRDLIDGETLQEMAKRGTWYVPTLSFLDGLIRVAEGSRWEDDPLVQACVWPAVLEGLRDPGRTMSNVLGDRQRLGQWKKRLQTALSNVQRAALAGVPIVVGTDAGNPGVFHGVAVHRELELLVGAGLSPAEAIVAATGNAARYLGVGSYLGTIAPGKKADVLIVEGNPLQDIRATRRIWAVIKDGHLINRERLLRE